MPVTDPLRDVLSRLNKVREASEGYMACCPAHEDKSPSLSVKLADDGKVLLNCHAGCTSNEVVDAMGIGFGDLFPDDLSSGDGSYDKAPPVPKTNGQKEKPKGVPREKVLEWREALLEPTKGAARAALKYLTEKRGLKKKVLRAQGTGIRFDKGLPWIVFPLATAGDKVTLRKERAFDPSEMDWKRDGGGKPFIRTKPAGVGSRIYFFDDNSARQPLLLCEGETDTIAARSAGYTACFGSAGAGTFKDEWAEEIASRPSASKGVVICYDGDDAGRKGAQAAAEVLHKAGAAVRIAQLPEGADTNDVYREKGREGVTELVGKAKQYRAVKAKTKQETPQGRLLQWNDFPAIALPPRAVAYANATSAALGTDVSMIAVPMLAVMGAAVGNSACIRLRNSWREPSCLWTMVVSRSGTLKSPALGKAVRPVSALEAEAHENFQLLEEQHEHEQERYDNLSKSEKKYEDPPEEPPTRRRYHVKDTTIESVAMVHEENPRGLLLNRDELAGWFGSFDRYASGEADMQSWIEMYEGRYVQIDRKSSDKPVLDIQHPNISVCGTIQPSVLKRKLTEAHFESGFATRFLMTRPPETPRTWTEADVTDEARRGWDRVVRTLYERPFREEPEDISLSGQAKNLYVDFYDHNAALQRQVQAGSLRSMVSKLEAVAARLALIFTLALDPQAREITESAMRRALTLTVWFRHEVARIHQLGKFQEEGLSHDEKGLMELPCDFVWQDVAEWWGTQKSAAYKIIRRLKKDGYVKDAGHGKYRKTDEQPERGADFTPFQKAWAAEATRYRKD